MPGESEPLSLGHGMGGIDLNGGVAPRSNGSIRASLADRDGPGRGRRRAAYMVTAVGRADRLALLARYLARSSTVSLPGPRGSCCTASAMSRAMSPS